MLDLIGISKTFNPGTVNEKKALSNVSLHLKEGDFATIVGSNGAGKSGSASWNCTKYDDRRKYGTCLFKSIDITA